MIDIDPNILQLLNSVNLTDNPDAFGGGVLPPLLGGAGAPPAPLEGLPQPPAELTQDAAPPGVLSNFLGGGFDSPAAIFGASLLKASGSPLGAGVADGVHAVRAMRQGNQDREARAKLAATRLQVTEAALDREKANLENENAKIQNLAELRGRLLPSIVDPQLRNQADLLIQSGDPGAAIDLINPTDDDLMSPAAFAQRQALLAAQQAPQFAAMQQRDRHFAAERQAELARLDREIEERSAQPSAALGAENEAEAKQSVSRAAEFRDTAAGLRVAQGQLGELRKIQVAPSGNRFMGWFQNVAKQAGVPATDLGRYESTQDYTKAQALTIALVNRRLTSEPGTKSDDDALRLKQEMTFGGTSGDTRDLLIRMAVQANDNDIFKSEYIDSVKRDTGSYAGAELEYARVQRDLPQTGYNQKTGELVFFGEFRSAMQKQGFPLPQIINTWNDEQQAKPGSP